LKATSGRMQKLSQLNLTYSRCISHVGSSLARLAGFFASFVTQYSKLQAPLPEPMLLCLERLSYQPATVQISSNDKACVFFTANFLSTAFINDQLLIEIYSVHLLQLKSWFGTFLSFFDRSQQCRKQKVSRSGDAMLFLKMTVIWSAPGIRALMVLKLIVNME
jgi:hypothetical protein